MTQPSVLPNYERFATEQTLPNAANFAALGEFRLQSHQGSTSLPDREAMAPGSRIYDARGWAFYRGDGTALLPAFVIHEQAREDQMERAVEDAIVAERNRLARELHDAVTQTLFAASLIAEVLPDLWDMDEGEARKSTEELRQLTRGALAEMRTLLFELRPAALSQARLCDLLRQLSEAVLGRKGLPIFLDIAGDCEIPCHVKIELYRIVQESLNNIVKYARATQVELIVRFEADQVHIEIKDNGVGFEADSIKPTNLGLRMMRERAEAIHAQLQIKSQPGFGTTIVLDWTT